MLLETGTLFMIPLVAVLLALAAPGQGQDALDRFKKAYKGGDEERAAAVAQLA
jgi:hypothetical protein